MAAEVSRVTIKSEGYDPEDWLPLLEMVDEIDNTSRRFDDSISLEKYVNHEDNATGGSLTYGISTDHPAFLYLNYSPYLRSEHDVMLEVTVSLNPEVIQEPLRELNTVIDAETEYLTSGTGYASFYDFEDDLPDLGYITVPEGFDLEGFRSSLVDFFMTVDDIYDYSRGEIPDHGFNSFGRGENQWFGVPMESEESEAENRDLID